MRQAPNPAVELTPPQVARELDKYIVGQAEAKRAVAIALRNRWRRRHVVEELRDEIHPKNILMIGPTGVGKTEIARRLAKLADAPFLKVEATKYTEIGYVGKDVESIVRDLVEVAIHMVREKERELVAPKAREIAEERLLDLLVPLGPSSRRETGFGDAASAAFSSDGESATREKFRALLREGKLEDREVEVDVQERQLPAMDILAVPGMEEMESSLRNMLGNMMPKRTRRRKMKVREARKYLEGEEATRLVDMEQVIPRALEKAQNDGIIFLDEMDKIADTGGGHRGGPNVSREGVQRDLLPIVEGTSVNTKHGVVKTDHILFIGAGAFYHSKPSDLMPELQGRFPIRVELKSLTRDDFVRILKEPRNSLLRQYEALLQTENVRLEFDEEAVATLAELAISVNERAENIGARRLHTILERVLDEVSFSATEIPGQTVQVTSQYIKDRVGDLVRDEDLSRYIL